MVTSVLNGVSVMADWMDDEVEIPENTLTNAQVFALLRMTEALRCEICMQMVGEIKINIAQENEVYAMDIWNGLSEQEQTALWVAPKFGGVFTTKEREIIRGFNNG